MKKRKQALCLICMASVIFTSLTLTVGALGSMWVWAGKDEKEPVTDYAYSFVAVGDTQIICESYPEQMTKLYDWIVASVEEKKIAYVFGLGDITNHTTSAEWQVAKREIAKLDGVVPYSLVRGNHDSINGFNVTFKNEAYISQFEGFYQEGRLENSWRTFSVCDVDYLFITLDYGASDALLKWAGEIIEAHPHHRVIISTHGYMHRYGARVTPSNSSASPNPNNLTDGSVNHGEQMWTKLFSQYENIFMVLSGHISTDNVEMSEAKGRHGNTVYQFLIDPQSLDSDITGATGMVAILYFSEDGRTVSVEQYSTAKEQYYRSSSQYSFEIPAYDPHSYGDFASDDNATCLTLGTETAKCGGCDKTLTREVGTLAAHSYADGACTVCGASDPAVVTTSETAPTKEPISEPEETPSSDENTWLTSTVLPGAIFLGAMIVGYVLGKRYKKK